MNPYVLRAVSDQRTHDLLESAAKERLTSQAAALNGHVPAGRRAGHAAGQMLSAMNRLLRGAVGSLRLELPTSRLAAMSNSGERRSR